jgi:hypothetical protein
MLVSAVASPMELGSIDKELHDRFNEVRYHFERKKSSLILETEHLQIEQEPKRCIF